MTFASVVSPNAVFICINNNNTSTLKVLDGVVTITPFEFEPAILYEGEEISVNDSGLSPISNFLQINELKKWDKSITGEVYDYLIGKGTIPKNSNYYIPVAVGFFVLILGILYVYKETKKK